VKSRFSRLDAVKPKDVYSVHKVDRAPAAADFNLLGDKVPMGRVVRIETFACVDLTTENKVIRLGVKRRGTIFWLKRETVTRGDSVNAISEYGVILEAPLILTAGEQPAARVESAANKDEIHMFARGPYI